MIDYYVDSTIELRRSLPVLFSVMGKPLTDVQISALNLRPDVNVKGRNTSSAKIWDDEMIEAVAKSDASVIKRYGFGYGPGEPMYVDT
jgi:hypothetical protein